LRSKLKKILRQILPPFLVCVIKRTVRWADSFRLVVRLKKWAAGVTGFRSLATPPEWEAVENTDEVWMSDMGWAHPSVVDTQRSKWKEFLAGVEKPKPFGVSHEAPVGVAPDVRVHNAIMTFGHVLGRTLAGRRNMSVLDWGGGLGHYAVYAREFYPSVDFDYVVKDVESLCAAGRSVLPDVKFCSENAEIFARQYDLVFASSSLHYTREFYPQLDLVCSCAGRYLMITRLPVVSTQDDFVVIQRPHRYGYLTQYACWFVNRKRLISFIEQRGFRLEREFLLGERPYVPNAPEQCTYGGFLFARQSSA
jgi:putative methyltransferase (TIGR04325 family)